MKKALKIIIILVVIAALGAGGYFGIKASKANAEPVHAFVVSNFADRGWDNSSSYGTISSGSNENYRKDQSVVTKVFVKAGDEVSEGDPLFQYDADSVNEAANQASNALKLAKLQYKKMEETLNLYWSVQPKEKMEKDAVLTLDLINALEQAANYDKTDTLSEKKYDGSEDRPFEFNCTTQTMIDPVFLLVKVLDAPEDIIVSVSEYSTHNYFDDLRKEAEQYEKELEEYNKAKEAYDKLTDEEKAAPDAPKEPKAPKNPGDEVVSKGNGKYIRLFIYNQLDKYKELNLKVGMEQIAVLEIRPRDITKADILEMEQLLYNGFSMADILPKLTPAGIFAADEEINDPYKIVYELKDARKTEPLTGEIPVPEVLFQTEEERLQAIIGVQQNMESQKLAIAQAEVTYKRAAASTTDGIVRAKGKGLVKEVNDYKSLNFGDTFLKIMGETGYVVRGTVSEMNRDKASVGSTITVNSYMTGMMFPATVTRLYDNPTRNNMSYSEDPNTSFYQFEAAIDPEIEVNPDDWVEIQFEVKESDSFYIPTAFIRKDGGTSYVMKHEDGKLVKQPVKVGRTLYGYQIEILKGLTMEDAIAFPYGKKIVEGARCEISENLRELYE